MMNPEQPSFEANKARESSGIPASFVEALKAEQPDKLRWDRADAAVAVLKGEKDAVTPKPEEKPTESQLFWRDMYRTGKLSPYQKDRPGISLQTIGEAWSNPRSQNTDSKIMAVDMALRGGADKEYNQLGGLGKRATRMGVMALNAGPAIALDIITSIPPNLLDTAFKVHFEDRIKASRKNIENNINADQNQQELDKLLRQSSLMRGAFRMGEVMNDKNVTAAGDWLMRQLTGEKSGWFTGESSDKLNDLLTGAFKETIEDFVNGPTLESGFRFLYEIPVVGALVEQAWTRMTLFQTKTAFHKGNLKGVYAGIGLLIGIFRDADNKDNKTPSWAISNSIWNRFSSHKVENNGKPVK